MGLWKNGNNHLIYQPSKWDSYQWQQFHNRSEQAQGVVKEGKEKIFSFPSFANECFHLHYNPSPKKVESIKPEHQWAKQSFNELEQLPDFDRLRQRTQGDKFLSGVSSQAFCEKYLEKAQDPDNPLEDPEPLRSQVRTLQEILKQQQQAGQDCA